MQDGLADEQHAYAVYAAVIEQFGAVRPFTNIQKAEAQHMAAWEFLFDRYGIPTPQPPSLTCPNLPAWPAPARPQPKPRSPIATCTTRCSKRWPITPT